MQVIDKETAHRGHLTQTFKALFCNFLVNSCSVERRSRKNNKTKVFYEMDHTATPDS